MTIRRQWRYLGLALCLWGGAAQAVENYSPRVLGNLGGPNIVVYGVSDALHVVGVGDTASGEQRAFLWSDGVMTDLGTLGGASSVAYAVNSAGQVVGKAQTASGDFHAFVYSNGVMTDLGTLGGAESVATGINVHGDIVGWPSGSRRGHQRQPAGRVSRHPLRLRYRHGHVPRGPGGG